MAALADDNPTTPETPANPLLKWVRANATQFAITAAAIVAVCRYLHPIDVLLAGCGFGLVIFLHELGHFAAAKLCNVHVKTFSIGFGPAVPFCSFRAGETTYKLAMIPLGGFVSMVGEGEDSNDVAADDPDPDRDKEDRNPRSFKNQTVLERMFIISAGVVMNILLAAVCFVVIYRHGVEEKPAVAARVEPGSAAWRAGIRGGTEILRLNSRENPWFDDISPIVSSTSKGQSVEMVLRERGVERTASVEPARGEGDLYPRLGVEAPKKLTLLDAKREPPPPTRVGSPAARATITSGGSDGPAFRPGDELVGMSDPAAPGTVTPFDPAPDRLPGAAFDFARRLDRLAGKPVTIRLTRKGDSAPVDVTVPPAFHYDLGLRMRLGAVAAVRAGSPAEKAGIAAEVRKGEQVLARGDEIVGVTLPTAAGKRRLAADPAELAAAGPGVAGELLDPLRLPFELGRWAEANPGAKVTLTVLRSAEGDHTPRQVSFDLDYDPSFRDEPTAPLSPGAPVPLNGLGVAYHVLSVVSRVEPDTPAARAGLQPNDKVARVRYLADDAAGNRVPQRWQDLKAHQWAAVDAEVQAGAPHGVELELERDGGKVTAELIGVEDQTWPVAERGLLLAPDTRLQKAESIGQALEMGLYRTGRAVRMIYLNLYATVFGRISFQALSGPITLARSSYLIAGQDVWHLILWMALISVNLAVVNFLPIPVLDGGHMVFLIYEAVVGRPAPVSVQIILTYLGLAMVGGLMLFVIGLDIYRLFFA